MKYIKSIIFGGLLAVSATSFAQNDESGYFTKGNLYRHDLNAAFGNDKNYIAMPALGNITATTMGNIGLRDVLFNRGGSTVTFMHPSVTTGEFLGNISDKNRLNEEFSMQLLGAGFKGFGGYNTIEINVKENLGVIIPGSILELAKTGLTNSTYDISGLKANADTYAEIAFGHSRQWNDKLRVGAKFKVLLGGGDVNALVNSGTVTLGANGYTAYVNATLDASVKGLEYKMSDPKEYKTNEYDPSTGKMKTEYRSYINDINMDNTGINGWGLAVDLGAEYKINDDLTVSAGINDFGFISWAQNHHAYSNGIVNTAEYTFNADSEAWNNFDDMFSALGDDFAKMYQLKSDEFVYDETTGKATRIKENSGSRSTMLAATLHFGAEYVMPFYRHLTVGLLNTTKLYGSYSYTNFRLSANVDPCKVFSASGTVALGTYGASLGGVLNLHCTGFNIFLATDHVIGKMAKQGIPLSSNGSFSLGINFPFN